MLSLSLVRVVHRHPILDLLKPVWSTVAEAPANSISDDMSRGDSGVVIVGIDPGTTCGLAIIGLDGHPISVESHRNMNRSQILERICAFGSPLLVASDVIPASSLVRKIASNLDAVLFVPERDIPTEQKEAIWRATMVDQKMELKDCHARDALAAAVKAYQAYKNKLAKVDLKITEEKLHHARNRVKKLVVKGHSIAGAVALIKHQISQSPVTSQVRKTESPTVTRLRLERIVLDQAEKIKNLEAENLGLRKQLTAAHTQLQATQETLSKREEAFDQQLHRERTYQQQRTLIDKLQRELNQLKSLARRQEAHEELIHLLRTDGEAGEFIVLRELKEFTSETTEAAIRSGIIRAGECILLANAGGGGVQAAENLSSINPRAVICCTGMSHNAREYFREKGIPVIQASKLTIMSCGEVKYVRKLDLERLTIECAEVRKREYEQELKIAAHEDSRG